MYESSTLLSLNLPASIQALEMPVGLPPSLLEKSRQIRTEGGSSKLRSMMQDVARIADSDRGILNEAENMLQAEEIEDTHAREDFTADRWRRPPSAALNQQLRAKMDRFRQTIDAAMASDRLVRQKYEEWKDQIEVLAGPEARLS